MTDPSDDGEHTSTLIGRLGIQDLQQNCPLQRREVGVGISLDSRLASSWIGDAELFQKMEEAQIKIKRDSKCRAERKQDEASLTRIESCIRRFFILLM